MRATVAAARKAVRATLSPASPSSGPSAIAGPSTIQQTSEDKASTSTSTSSKDTQDAVTQGYPGQITGSKKYHRNDPADDDDDDPSPDDEPLDLGPLAPRSLYALRNLARFGRRQRAVAAASAAAASAKQSSDKNVHNGSHKDRIAWDEYYPDWPQERRAGVMVALFGGKTGELNVVLSTRAMDLRVNPGEVALPGGKVEQGDTSLEHTARREAFEEIGLPMQRSSVRHLCNLPPFLARSAPLLVTPVVCFILDPTLKPKLNPSEVSNIFSHPLHSFLTETPPSPYYVPHTVHNGTKPYRLQYDIKWLENSPYRMFRFEGRLNPIWGFTADILIHVAMLAYQREPEFQRKAPGQLKRRELIQIAQQQLREGHWPWPARPKVQPDSQESSLGDSADRNNSKL